MSRRSGTDTTWYNHRSPKAAEKDLTAPTPSTQNPRITYIRRDLGGQSLLSLGISVFQRTLPNNTRDCTKRRMTLTAHPNGGLNCLSGLPRPEGDDVAPMLLVQAPQQRAGVLLTQQHAPRTQQLALGKYPNQRGVGRAFTESNHLQRNIQCNF